MGLTAAGRWRLVLAALAFLTGVCSGVLIVVFVSAGTLGCCTDGFPFALPGFRIEFSPLSSVSWVKVAGWRLVGVVAWKFCSFILVFWIRLLVFGLALSGVLGSGSCFCREKCPGKTSTCTERVLNVGRCKGGDSGTPCTELRLDGVRLSLATTCTEPLLDVVRFRMGSLATTCTEHLLDVVRFASGVPLVLVRCLGFRLLVWIRISPGGVVRRSLARFLGGRAARRCAIKKSRVRGGSSATPCTQLWLDGVCIWLATTCTELLLDVVRLGVGSIATTCTELLLDVVRFSCGVPLILVRCLGLRLFSWVLVLLRVVVLQVGDFSRKLVLSQALTSVGWAHPRMVMAPVYGGLLRALRFPPFNLYACVERKALLSPLYSPTFVFLAIGFGLSGWTLSLSELGHGDCFTGVPWWCDSPSHRILLPVVHGSLLHFWLGRASSLRFAVVLFRSRLLGLQGASLSLCPLVLGCPVLWEFYVMYCKIVVFQSSVCILCL